MGRQESTQINTDANQPKDYGEKFYDIVSIEKQAKHSAMSGTFATKATPHKIRFADGSPDMLTIAQKQRVVNRGSATYSAGDSETSTAMAEAFRKAGIRNPSYDEDNWEIAEYIVALPDASTQEKKDILIALGFKVDANGKITWD